MKTIMRNNLSYILPIFFLQKFLKLQKFFELEKKLSDNISLSKKIWLWKNGFNSLHMRMFGLTPDNISNYLSNRNYHKMHPINGVYSKLIDNKAFLPLILPDYQKYAFDVFIFISKGRIIYNQEKTNLPLVDFVEDLVNKRILICKPVNSGGGSGFELVNKENFRQVLKSIIKSKEDYIITEKIEQHQYSDEIFPDSINTIRLLLMRDVETRELFIARGFHRFGTLASKPVDNIDKGGVVANLDLENGTLSKILIYRNKYKDRELFEYYPTHPDTGKTIEGVEIPHWKEIKKNIIDLFGQMEWFVYGGIDVVVTNDSFKILEINSLPGINAMQMFEPSLLSDVKVAKFFKLYSPSNINRSKKSH